MLPGTMIALFLDNTVPGEYYTDPHLLLEGEEESFSLYDEFIRRSMCKILCLKLTVACTINQDLKGTFFVYFNIL